MTKTLKILSVIFFLLIGFLLTFHVFIFKFSILPKEHLTFHKTFISEEDEIDILRKLNFGSPLEKQMLNNNSLANKIKENWNVYQTEECLVFEHINGRKTMICK